MVNSVSEIFSNDALVDRAFYRIAWNIRYMWEETGSSDTRLFLEPIIPHKFVLAGRSDGGTYNEHVVPRVMLCEACHNMLSVDHSDESLITIAMFLKKYLKVVQITKDEQMRLDFDLKLKQKMPDGWTYDTGNVFARLDAAGIHYELF